MNPDKIVAENSEVLIEGLADLIGPNGKPLDCKGTNVILVDTECGEQDLQRLNVAGKFVFLEEETPQVVAMCSGLDPNGRFVKEFLYILAIMSVIGAIGVADLASFAVYPYIRGENPVDFYTNAYREIVDKYGTYLPTGQGELYVREPFGSDD